MHRDIKLENFLVDDDYNVILADLGVVKNIASAALTFVGTMVYMAPEMHEQHLEITNDESYSSAVDIWALGACYMFLPIALWYQD